MQEDKHWIHGFSLTTTTIVRLNWELRDNYQLHRRRRRPERPWCQWRRLRRAPSEPIDGRRRRRSLHHGPPASGPCTLSGRAWCWMHGAVMGFWRQWRVHGGEGNKQWMPSLSLSTFFPLLALSLTGPVLCLFLDQGCVVPIVVWRKMAGFGWILDEGIMRSLVGG